MKNKKIVNLMVGTLFLSSLMMGGLYTKDTMDAEANVKTLDYSINELSDIYDGEQEFFITSYTSVDDKLNIVSKTSDKLENIFLDNLVSKEKELKLNNKLDSLLEVTSSKLSIGNKINELFKQDVDLSKQNKDLVADLTILDELNLDNDLSNISNDSQFYKNVNFYIGLAKNQKKEQDSAKKSLEKVFSKGKVISTDKKYLDTAKENINKVKDEEVKKELLKHLEIPQKQHEKEEAERIAKEKAEKERIAKEKAEKERIEREKAEKERIEREKAEQERIEREKQNTNVVQEQYNSISQSSTEMKQNNTESIPRQTQSIPSSGVYINGVSSPIGYYNQNGGSAPLYTNVAYLWSYNGAPTNYYLIDYTNSVGLGLKVLDLQVGNSVYINGINYTVTGSQTVYPGQSTDTIDLNHSAFLQTCYGAGNGDAMKLVYLD